ncbi:CDP-alcohol phosphatidyltransferase family protein [Vibrio sp. vnigr-6D03]|uniref:CDP-alcohol phosphatidyltransferase family protein n=1 Tax=Vibrio sp. vnigr-6D03 TaxID=2058088 RepID=UPI000C338450|nr:CDP-alcohol phosphatidyltransferase family protein [Vibrio sp. vnigr-6D03]PKF77595.1 CDP-alcohol phosphatidyltransferase family protein [Vibrio sp. vnigr-6D03]
MSSNQEVEGRRPLKVRQAGFSKKIAAWLAGKSITPNQISIASVVFSALSAICLSTYPFAYEYAAAGSVFIPNTLLVLTALFIQCRLLCNLFDGMVAVEGGKSTPYGELFNDIPDRVADSFIFIALGFHLSAFFPYAMHLGWAAALLAVFTAYVRTLATSIGSKSDFRGPMAKQHRMALVTLASIATIWEHLWFPQGSILLATLIVIVLGCVITIVRRARAAYVFLESGTES